MSDESVGGINQLRKPAVVVSVRVSEGCRGTIVRRLSPAEGTLTELASGSAFVGIFISFRRHRNEFGTSRKPSVGQIRVLIV